MTRRCSHCNKNGDNSRTCPNRGVKLFGVRLTEGSIRKSASMSNLSGSGLSGLGLNNPGSPGDGPDHGGGGDGYASEDFVPGSSSSRERKKGNPWRGEEHRMFLMGLQKLGKGDWRGISRNYVKTRTPTQVASHAQKFFIRQSNVSRRKRRSSLFDIVPDELMDSQELQAKDIPMQGTDSVPAPLILEREERESMKSANSVAEEPPTASASFRPEETIQTQLQPPGSFPVLYPAYCSPFLNITIINHNHGEQSIRKTMSICFSGPQQAVKSETDAEYFRDNHVSFLYLRHFSSNYFNLPFP